MDGNSKKIPLGMLRGKSATTSSPIIAFRFRTGDDELEELQLQEPENEDKKTKQLGSESELADSSRNEGNKSEDDRSDSANGSTPVKEYWSLLGKRSTSVESGCESTSDAWRKLNELKGKITKTVEEKISEMKIERNKSSNVLGISSRSKLINSKENSSISDSEDTSESSRLSESIKDEDSSPKKKFSAKSETVSGIIDGVFENVATETESEETESEKNRKSNIFSNIVKLSDIKISTAKSEAEVEENLIEVESGVEADENLKSGDKLNSTANYDDAIKSRIDEKKQNSQARSPPSRSDENSGVVRNLHNILFTNRTEFIILLTALLIYHYVPLPQFLKGFICGLFFTIISCYIYRKAISLNFASIESYVPEGAFKIPAYEFLPPLRVPKTTPSKGVWFNEYTREYDPDFYSVTQTVPVYLRIKDSYLKLSRPKGKINKRATYDEPEYKPNFVSHRLYNIRNCTVLLLPEGLARKRLFSKKYPIVVMLRPDSFITRKEKDKDSFTDTLDEDEDTDGTETDETISQSFDSYGRMYLNLFARCDREKEEWYRKLLDATKSKLFPDINKPEKENCSVKSENAEEEEESTEPATPFENIVFDEQEAQHDEYMRYMSQFVDIRRLSTASVTNEEESKNEDDNKSTTQMQWFNAFINRILFDVFRSPFWLDKIHDKIQKKINSIRLPYYIEDIEVVELDLGKTGPTFHRASSPLLDERGLWFDLDLTFDGQMKVTIQTQLNLVKLQKGMEVGEDEDLLPPNEKPKKEVYERKMSKPTPETSDQQSRSPMYDSELEDSAESSDEDEDEDDEIQSSTAESAAETSPVPRKKHHVPHRKSSKKIFRIFENVAQSKYFKSVAQSKYVQKAIAGVSKTKLRLSLEIKGCVGTIAVNIPPPPSDRLWYGFREMPKVWISAHPKIGEKTVRITHVKNFLEKKIMQEFKKVMVLPNMDEFILPTYPSVFNLVPSSSSNSQPVVPDVVTTPPTDENEET